MTTGPVLELRGVTHAVADGPRQRVILDGVDLAVNQAELMAQLVVEGIKLA